MLIPVGLALFILVFRKFRRMRELLWILLLMIKFIIVIFCILCFLRKDSWIKIVAVEKMKLPFDDL